VSASFTYDGTRRRRGKTISGTTTNFLYDQLNFVQEQSGGGSPTANLLTGLGIDETFTRTDAGGTNSLLMDPLRSTVAQTDASGSVQTQYRFEPFGATTASGVTSTNTAQFTGRENDGTDLYFYRARYYSPQMQRFASEDPIGFLGGYNVYRYVEDNPVNFVDPLGLDSCVWFGLSSSLGFGIAGQYLVQIGRCTDDCGKTKWKKRQCLCTGLGAGLSAGPGVEMGNDLPVSTGWSVSTPGGSYSGSPYPSGVSSPGWGLFYFKCVCDVRDSAF